MRKKLTDTGVSVFLSRHGEHLKTVQFSDCKYITAQSLYQVANTCPRLEALEIIGCNWQHTWGGLLQIMRWCKRLHHLVLNELDWIHDTCIDSIARNCGVRLRHLSLAGSYDTVRQFGPHIGLTMEGIVKNLIPRCPNLESLDLRGILYGDVSLGDVAAAFRTLPNLRHLWLNGDSPVLAAIAAEDVMLTTLTVVKSVDKEILLSPQPGLQFLRELSLPTAFDVTDEEVLLIISHLPALRFVTIDRSGFTERTVRLLDAHCRNNAAWQDGRRRGAVFLREWVWRNRRAWLVSQRVRAEEESAARTARVESK